MKKLFKVLMIISLIITTMFSSTIVQAKNWKPYFEYEGAVNLVQGQTAKVTVLFYENYLESTGYEVCIYDEKNDKILVFMDNAYHGYPDNHPNELNLTWNTKNLDAGTYYVVCFPYYYSDSQENWILAEENIAVYPIVLEDKNNYPQQIQFPYESKVVNLYQSIQLSATVLPDSAKDKSITYTSLDPKIATVTSNGKVTGQSAGTARIKATASNGVSNQILVYVYDKNFPFYDVPPHEWYRKIIEQAYNIKLVKGLKENIFGPNENMTRGMVATILHRLAGQPYVKFEQKFKDVKDGQYYSQAITWASNAKIISGYASGNFGPDDPITREQMAAMCYNFAKFKIGKNPSATTSLTEFRDYKSVTSYMQTPMKWAVAAGIISGSDGQFLKPTKKATRAECTKMLYQLQSILPK